MKPLQHCCSNSPENIRTEVNFLKEDCNKRIAQVIFQTLMIVHYTTVVPCIFAPVGIKMKYHNEVNVNSMLFPVFIIL